MSSFLGLLSSSSAMASEALARRAASISFLLGRPFFRFGSSTCSMISGTGAGGAPTRRAERTAGGSISGPFDRPPANRGDAAVATIGSTAEGAIILRSPIALALRIAGGRKFIVSIRAMSFISKRLDLTMPTNGGVSIALVGASRSGKTTLMKYLYRKFFSKHITMMCSMNPQAEIYKDLDSKVVISQEYHPELLREAHEINQLTDNKFPICFISDDYVDVKIKNDPEITRCMTIMRNAAISSIWSFQGRTLMSAVGRNNINFIAVFKQQTPKEWECVIKEFLSMWLPPGMTMREMVEFCRVATEAHQFFFIDNINGVCYLSKLQKDQLEDD